MQLHNFLLQSLLLSGIMGMLLVASVCLLSALRFLQLCFKDNGSVEMSQLVLGLPALGCMVFGLAESGFFNYTDARTLFFYLMCGMLLGTYYDLKAFKL